MIPSATVMIIIRSIVLSVMIARVRSMLYLMVQFRWRMICLGIVIRCLMVGIVGVIWRRRRKIGTCLWILMR